MQSKRSLIKNRKGVSPAVSTVIITAASVVLVLVAANYALQVLQSQRAVAEFDTVQNSILAFDDAVRDIAWDRSGSRSIRFTNSYGNMRLIANGRTINITASGLNGAFTDEFTTAIVKYQMPTGYGMPGVGSSYILGNNTAVISKLTDSLGQVFVQHESGFNTVTLSYRVRVAEEGSMDVAEVGKVNYVDIFVIRLNCNTSATGGDFNLVCKNIGLKTTQSTTYTVNEPVKILVSDGTKTQPDEIELNLTSGLVVFNTIVADVRVSY